ncbi:hypothetical protein BACUNI_00647 [Bacteroides uniformis ATCC 8492]|uniref:Uncharacterized protein n=1 Tax=Bacteroides uniformis (strain ATCC 8492 / DSM 6597 / CCUG 4942 / CIP 103695 / JCM 5828 / KCTC 5204 / NCTC 13054 / VPI 0061) TaxID=411479 RepID=A0ABC9NFU5_BACUC|nr:hypothetical protein BACUNI_00647 [Bacteroides uniformis ATCC 8492]
MREGLFVVFIFLFCSVPFFAGKRRRFPGNTLTFVLQVL